MYFKETSHLIEKSYFIITFKKLSVENITTNYFIIKYKKKKS